MRRTVYHYSRSFQGKMREGFLLRLQGKKGEGWSEISPLPGFSSESLEEALEDFRTNAYALPSVQFGYHTALLDLHHPIPLHSIPIKIKIKVGHLTPIKALKMVQCLPHSSIRIDMNRKWKLEEALYFAKRFSSVEYFEEPLSLEEDAHLFPYPVALDESLRERTPPPYPNIVAHIVKPTMHGFPLPKIQPGIDTILSSSYETELGIHHIAKLTHHLHIPLKPMGLGTCHLFDDALFEEVPYIKEGWLYFPKRWTLKKEKVQIVFDEKN